MRVREHRFRASQVCRVLGSPISYNLACLILRQGPVSLSTLQQQARRSKATTCYHLTKLRLAQIVRYETRQGETVYWIKYPEEVRRLLDALDTFVDRAGQRLREDD
jgi:hypothetical protein